jgi:hypothetical protein
MRSAYFMLAVLMVFGLSAGISRAQDKAAIGYPVKLFPDGTGVYDVNVHNQDQVLIAVFRGRSHRLKGPLVEV